MRVVDFVIDNILLDGRLYTTLYENILIYNISYKKHLCVKNHCVLGLM